VGSARGRLGGGVGVCVVVWMGDGRAVLRWWGAERARGGCAVVRCWAAVSGVCGVSFAGWVDGRGVVGLGRGRRGSEGVVAGLGWGRRREKNTLLITHKGGQGAIGWGCEEGVWGRQGVFFDHEWGGG